MQITKTTWILLVGLIAICIVEIFITRDISFFVYREECRKNIDINSVDMSALMSFKFFEVMNKIK